MGSWGSKPWENDSAADWYANLFNETKFIQKIESTLKRKITDENYEQIRAAAFLLVLMGRVYMWPITKLDEDLKLAIKCLEKILQDNDIELDEDSQAEIQDELSKLRSELSTE